jgi:sporulation protein YlmC with PRC-barrel domain
MLRNVKTLREYQIRASDGYLGALEEFYVDTKDWTIRYILVSPDQGQSDQSLILSTPAVDYVNETDRTIFLTTPLREIQTSPKVDLDHPDDDFRLRATKTLIGYYIEARDGDIGHVEDFVVDDQTWMINYMIVNTGNWLPGRNVVVSPSCIESIDWSESKVHMELLRETIEKSPEFDPQFLQ